MAISENILTGRKHRFCYDSTPGAKKWYRLSYWTHASDVTFDSGVTLENTINSINNDLEKKADILTANQTVYVSALGNDDTGDGTSGNPWRTIQYALDYAPKVTGNYEYTVILSGGKYEGFMAAGINAKIMLNDNVEITGGPSSANNALVDINNATITFISTQHHTVQFASENTSYVLYIHNSGNFNCYNVDVEVDGKNNGLGITATTNSGYTSSGQDTTRISNAKTAINVGPNSSFFSYTIAGTGNKTGISVQGGIVTCNSYTIEADLQILKTSGGRIYSEEQE